MYNSIIVKYCHPNCNKAHIIAPMQACSNSGQLHMYNAAWINGMAIICTSNSIIYILTLLTLLLQISVQGESDVILSKALYIIIILVIAAV